MKLAQRLLAYTHVPSPVGELLLAGEDQRLHLISFPTGAKAKQPAPSWRRDEHLFREARAQLEAYFEGALKTFDLDLAVEGTFFQQAVWNALREIPYGATASYGDIARRIGRPTATRAVGMTNGANPLPIIVPCHRVVGAKGALTGFGGGLDIKLYLLQLESGGMSKQPRLL